MEKHLGRQGRGSNHICKHRKHFPSITIAKIVSYMLVAYNQEQNDRGGLIRTGAKVQSRTCNKSMCTYNKRPRTHK